MTSNTLLKIDQLTKLYPGVRALDGFTCDFTEGEIHAIIGENGAGKSTLIKCISGAIQPDSGIMYWKEEAHTSFTPSLARHLGIEVIYQEFNLVPSITAAENIFLNEKTGKGVFLNPKEREKEAQKILDSLNVHLSASELVKDMSPACMQLVEIARAVSRNAKLLIMDEPTAPLTMAEVGTLFKIIQDLKSRGVTIIYISHRLEEIFEIADRVTVMRDGHYITTKDITETDRDDLIHLMTGRELTNDYPERDVKLGEEALRVEHLSGNGVSDISFSVRKGEVLGFAGLVGAGRTELMQVVYGAAHKDEGKIFRNGKEVKITSPSAALQNGIGYIPEDRKNQGVFLNYDIQWNTVISVVKRLSYGPFTDSKREREVAEMFRDRFKIKTPGLDQKTRNLSGGNQQKVVLAKTMACETEVLIFDEPTRGIDVGAKWEIYKLINELVEAGHAVIMVSSDMPELIGMSDRIITISEGKLTASLEKSEFRQELILDYASGRVKDGSKEMEEIA